MTRETGPDGSEVFFGDKEERLNSYIDGNEVGEVLEEFLISYLGDVNTGSDFYQRNFNDGAINERGLMFFGDVLNEYRKIIEKEYPGEKIEDFLEGSKVNRRGFGYLLMNMMKNAIERADDASQMAMDSMMEGYVNKTSLPGAMAIRSKMLEMKQSGDIYGLISCDADFFKTVNDNYGHPVGDAVLKHLAKVIKGCVRDCFPVRAGGEEMDLILNFNGDIDALLRVAERVRKNVEATPCYLKCIIDDDGAIINFDVINADEYEVVNTITGETRKRRGIETVINERREGVTMRTMFLMISVTLSIGVDLVDGKLIDISETADQDEVGEVYNGLRSFADKQCYFAKEAGRNRIYGNNDQYRAQ